MVKTNWWERWESKKKYNELKKEWSNQKSSKKKKKKNKQIDWETEESQKLG